MPYSQAFNQNIGLGVPRAYRAQRAWGWLRAAFALLASAGLTVSHIGYADTHQPALPALSEAQRTTVAVLAKHLCANTELRPTDISSDNASVVRVDANDLERRGRTVGHTYDVHVDNQRYRVQRLASPDLLRRITIDVYAQSDPDRLRAAIVVNAQCAIQGGRIRDDSENAIPDQVFPLAASLGASDEPIAINPAFDLALVEPSGQTASVRVAVIDSGVDYRQPRIARRLARQRDGSLLGFDFWDMDDRPFDSHPRAHPFFVQRHGTRTVSILADEAPLADIVVYRYPRPDMSRMRALIDHAAKAGVSIVNLSLGGRNSEEWQSYYAAAKAHPEILFVVSAGNNGIDLDQSPVWPASFKLANQITVTSALSRAQLAERVNYGVGSVHLMVPAENMIATEYAGRARLVSGSSYAAARISALAACLRAGHSDWRAVELREAIFAMAQPAQGAAKGKVAVGYIDDPVLAQRGLCRAEPVSASVVHQQTINFSQQSELDYLLEVAVVVNRQSDWTPAAVLAAIEHSRVILRQCDIDLRRVHMSTIEGGVQHQYFEDRLATSLLESVSDLRPVIVFLQGSLQDIEYGAQAYGRSNTRRMKLMRDSVWMMANVEDPGIALAHELYHVLADSGLHKNDAGNLMNERTAPTGDRLTSSQCGQLRNMALAGALIKAQ